MSEYTGIYRASVYDTADPASRGRIRVLVPQVLGEAPSAWAEPTLEINSKYSPAINERVWVLFEGGDVNRPSYISKMAVTGANILGGTITSDLLDPDLDLGMSDEDRAALDAHLAQLDLDLADLAEQMLGVDGDLDDLADALDVVDDDLAGMALTLGEAADDIIATNNRLNLGGDVHTAIDAAANSPVTDERLTTGSLTVWPFASDVIPPGTITDTTIADFSLVARKFNTTQHLVY